MARYVKGLRESLIESFETGVKYIQGSICRDPYEVRRLRWMSLHTVLGHMAARYDVGPDIHKACGFDADVLATHRRE